MPRTQGICERREYVLRNVSEEVNKCIFTENIPYLEAGFIAFEYLAQIASLLGRGRRTFLYRRKKRLGLLVAPSRAIPGRRNPSLPGPFLPPLPVAASGQSLGGADGGGLLSTQRKLLPGRASGQVAVHGGGSSSAAVLLGGR
jgi:hypothetical protein